MKKQGLQQIYLLHLKLSEVINTILNLFFLRRFNSLPCLSTNLLDIYHNKV